MYQLLSNSQFYEKNVTLVDLDITTTSPIIQIDESYLNVLQSHLDPITFSIPPLFTGLGTQEFPYEERNLQNQTTFVEVNECSEIPREERPQRERQRWRNKRQFSRQVIYRATMSSDSNYSR